MFGGSRDSSNIGASLISNTIVAAPYYHSIICPKTLFQLLRPYSILVTTPTRLKFFSDVFKFCHTGPKTVFLIVGVLFCSDALLTEYMCTGLATWGI